MQTAIATLLKQLNHIISGKENVIKLALTCIIARGHLLLEDLPGVGKTTLAHALALSLGLKDRRIQFTNDMLPSDLLGVTIFQPHDGRFVFRPGPIFHSFILADEINRASPKVQSALLEAMEEQQVSLDNHTHALPQPFMVIATQNPSEQVGTFPLPESQLDRFLMRLSLGYPDAAAEKNLYTTGDRRRYLGKIKAVTNAQGLLAWQQAADHIVVSPALIDYVYALVQRSRDRQLFFQGLSPRAGLAILRAARAHAFIENRQFVLPEDVQAIFIASCSHRLRPLGQGAHTEEILADFLVQEKVG